MSIVSRVREYVSERRARLERARTTRLINALPIEIQKDMGWPGFMPDPDCGRHPSARVARRTGGRL